MVEDGTIDITFTISDTDYLSFLDDLNEEIRGTPKFRPARLVVDAPYAEAIEYGTSPQDGTPHGAVDLDMADGYGSADYIKERLVPWVERKFKVGRRDAKRIAYFIDKNHRILGMPAQPFFRPAIYNILDHLPDDYFDRPDTSIMALLLNIKAEMQRILEENETIDTGYLIDWAIEVHPVDDIESTNFQSLPKLTNVNGLNGLSTDDFGLKDLDVRNKEMLSRKSLAGGKTSTGYRGTYKANLEKLSKTQRAKKPSERPKGWSNTQGIKSRGKDKRPVWNNARKRRGTR